MATIGIDNQTGEIIFEEYGRRITDPNQITYIKRHSDWKSKVYQLSTDLKNTIEDNIERNRSIHTRCPKMLTEQQIKQKVSQLNCNTYTISSFTKRAEYSIKNDAYEACRKYAECNASNNIFKRKSDIKKLSDKKLQEFVDFFYAKDSDAEIKYYKEENRIKQNKDNEYKQQYEKEKKNLLMFVSDDERQVNSSIMECLKTISDSVVPFKSSITYKSVSSHTCFAEIYLPDSSCIEQRLGNILASGKISIKQRKVKEIEEDWNLCCSGLILYIVASIFNVSTCIENVKICAKFIETNKALGSKSTVIFADCLFDRTTFATINFQNIDPNNTIQAFSANSKVKTQGTAPVPKATKSKVKSQYEIECSDELSQNSIAIIISVLKALLDRYGYLIFKIEEKNRLLSAIRDLFPKNEAEKQIVETLIFENCFADFIGSSTKPKAESNIKKVLSANSLDSDEFITGLDAIL